jgi:hypothetical protein
MAQSRQALRTALHRRRKRDGSEFIVARPPNAFSHAVAGLRGGGFVVVWANTIHGVKAKIFNAAGIAQRSLEISPPSESDYFYNDPSVSSLGNGDFVVV